MLRRKDAETTRVSRVVTPPQRASVRSRTTARRKAAGIAIVSNGLDPPADEGIKKSARELATILDRDGATVVPVGRAASLPARKLLLGSRIVRRLRAPAIQVVVYVPTQSATVGSFARSAILRLLTGKKIVLLALQPVDLGRAQVVLGRRVAPQLLLTPSPSLLAQAVRSGLDAAFVHLGVDTTRFAPAAPERKAALRRKYDLPEDRAIALHVGHARRLRGLEWLAELPADVVPVVVIGTSLGADPAVVTALSGAGVRVVDRFVPAIHELYQAADLYVFPVRDARSAIAAPLSVLEAMACNLPVVTTPFGALPRLFREGSGLFFAEDPRQFRARAETALGTPGEAIRTREQVLPLSWEAAAEAVLEGVTA